MITKSDGEEVSIDRNGEKVRLLGSQVKRYFDNPMEKIFQAFHSSIKGMYRKKLQLIDVNIYEFLHP